MNNLKIGTRLTINSGIALLILAIVGLYGMYGVNGIHDEVEILVEQRMVNVEKVNFIIDQINIVARATRNMILEESQQSRENEKKRIADARKEAGGALEYFSKAKIDDWSLEFRGTLTTTVADSTSSAKNRKKITGKGKNLLTSLHNGGSRAFSAEKRKCEVHKAFFG
jgi:methyl-accepting chemotaxis protein